MLGQEVPELLMRARAAGLSRRVSAGDARAPSHARRAVDAPVFPAVVVRQGRVAGRARAHAAGDRSRASICGPRRTS